MENTITFVCENADRKTILSCSAESTAYELADMFQEFLAGCGFYVTAEDLAQYFEEKKL